MVRLYLIKISSQCNSHTIQTMCCKTLHNPQPNSWTRHTWCPKSPAVWSILSIDTSCTCSRWCHPAASSSLPCPFPGSQLSCLPSSLPSPLSTCFVLGVCYVIQPVDLFPSSVQHYSALINANLHQSTTLVVASYKARKRFLHEYLHVTCTNAFYNAVVLPVLHVCFYKDG